MSKKRTYFISRAGPDKRWAELIASVVRDAGHEPIFQDEHFRVGQSIPDNMTRGGRGRLHDRRILAGLLRVGILPAELNAALMTDPLGRHGESFPYASRRSSSPASLAQLAYTSTLWARQMARLASD